MNRHFNRFFAFASAFAFALASTFAQDGTEWMKKVSPSLLDQTRDGQLSSFIILMTEQANVKEAKFIMTKEAKGEFVFQSLLFFGDSLSIP